MELLSLVILVIFALGIVILGTRGLFAKDLTAALKRVQQQEQALQEKADILEQRLGQMEHEYQAKLQHAKTEADEIAREAKSQAMNIRTAAIEEAKHRARQLLLEAEQGRSWLKAEVTKELDGQAIQRTCESLRALLSAQELKSLHGTLVNELLKNLPEVSQTALGADPGSLVVTTGQDLIDADIRKLTKWAQTVSGIEMPVEVATDAALVAGCVVRIGSVVVDNTLLNRLRQ